MVSGTDVATIVGVGGRNPGMEGGGTAIGCMPVPTAGGGGGPMTPMGITGFIIPGIQNQGEGMCIVCEYAKIRQNINKEPYLHMK